MKQYPITIRWTDVDTYGHVNNVAIAGLIQEARTYFFREISWFEAGVSGFDGARVIVANQAIEYLAQIPYLAEPILIDVWVEKVSGADIIVAYKIYDPAHKKCYVQAITTMVFVAKDSNRPRRLDAKEREQASAHLGEPIKFRTRRLR